MFSTRELINDISYSDSNIELINDNFAETFSLTTITNRLQSSHRYFYLQKNQTLKLFLTISCHLISSSEVKVSSTIPDAPPLPSNITPVDNIAEDTFGIKNLFDETVPTNLTTTSSNQQTLHRSLPITNRKRTILNRCLETDLCSDENFDHDDYYDLMNYLDKTYFNDNSLIIIIINDLKLTMNTIDQIEILTNLIKRSIFVPRFIHNILQNDLLELMNENLLLEKLGISFDRLWSLKISINTLNILLKIILKRKNNQLICLLWDGFLQSMMNSSDGLNLEHLNVFIVLFHQITIVQRKSILIQLVQTIQSSKPNFYLLILFEYMMYNIYEIPEEIINHIQQMILKNDHIPTTNFNQIVTKNNSTHVDGFALKALYNNSIYNQFYNYLIKQLDFTKINKGKYL